MSPMGIERHFSPRSNRSRSAADVDRLRKYAQRIEERRTTEGGETTCRLYTNRWLNLPKSPNFHESLQSPDTHQTLEITESHEKLVLRKSSTNRDDSEPSTWRQSMQSDDDDDDDDDDVVVHISPSDGGTLSFRWVPLPRIGDRPQHSHKSLNIELQGARYAASKWITFAKHPSPASSRSSLDRKSSLMKFSSYYDKQQLRRNRKKQETIVTAITTADDSSGQISPHVAAQKNENMKGSAITQKLHNLYKFRFDAKPSCNSSASHHGWMRNSKSICSSDDEDDSNIPTSSTNVDRRSSKNLECNEIKSTGSRRNPRLSNLKSSILNKFNEKLRFSEDLSSGRDKFANYERKAFSEDYEDSQAFQRRRWSSRLNSNNKNDSTIDAGNVDNPQDKVKRRRRRREDSGGMVKHSSVEYKSSSERVQVPARSLSYGAEGRPPTPVPMGDDGVGDYAPSKFSYLKEKRKSTRYKVYLT